MSQSDRINLLTARKGYEFRLDDLRLTMFCTQPVIQAIQQAFHFQAVAATTPPPTYAAVPNMLPPGLVFQVGMWSSPDDTIVPIRFLHVEPFRIVIDLAGPSSAVDGVYTQLRQLIADFHAPDGGPILGEPERVLNYSEISVPFPANIDRIFIPVVRNIFESALHIAEQNEDSVVVPSVQLQAMVPGQVFNGEVNVNNGHTFSLAVRGTTTPAEHIYFSGAPMDTEAHMAFVAALINALQAGE